MDDNLDRALGALGREDWERLGRYVEGRSSPEEAHAVREWIAGDPRREELVERMRRARVATRAAPELWSADEAWSRLLARLEQAPAEAQAQVIPLRRPRAAWFRRALRVAAVIAVFVGGGVLWQGRESLFRLGEPPVQEIVAGTGEMIPLTLADGTRVVLAPASRIWVPERFRKTREIRVEGEAVFDVTADASRPFLVRTAGSLTRVLGTRFGVRAYPDDDYVEVLVDRGRVAVMPTGSEARPQGAGLIVTAGLAVRIEPNGTLSAPRVVDAARLLAWTEGRLVFDGTPLDQVARALERRTGVRVELAAPGVADRRLFAEFKDVNPEEVIPLIARSLRLEYRETDDGYLLFDPASLPDTAKNGGSIR